MENVSIEMEEKLISEFGNKDSAIVTGQCSKEFIEKILELIDYKNSELTFRLPIKPYSYIWVMSTCKYLDIPESNSPPEGCQGIFTETCETCKYRDKECKSGAYAEEKWFHLDSPYLSTVLSEFGKTIFSNEEECIQACKEKFNSDIVDKLVKQYHDYREQLINVGVI